MFQSLLELCHPRAVIVGFALAVVCCTRRRRKSVQCVPPGPKAFPIIGNLLDFPAVGDIVPRMQEWKKDFGNMVYLTAFGQNLIVLNDFKTASDLLDKRGALYSGRPRFTMVGELCGFDRFPAIAPDETDKRLRAVRKLITSEIGANKVSRHEEYLEREVVTYILKLLDEPADFVAHNQWFAVDIIMLLSYGYRVASKNDYHMELATRIMHQLSVDALPGKWLVDMFPFMRHIPAWLPGAHFKRYAKQARAQLDDWVNRPWLLVKNQEITMPSIASRQMLLYPVLTAEAEDLIVWSTASIYAAGSDTTASALSSFFLAMTLFPVVQTLASSEISAVVGQEPRLPAFSDASRLPYTSALVLEVLRWGSVLPLGAPRRTTRSDDYGGYDIPQNSTVVVNIWGICHDPAEYPNPMEFDPSRFLGNSPQRDPRDVVFGYSRRICPGQHLAEKALFIAIATIVATFRIEPISRCPAKYEFDDGFISHPKPFKCKISSRSADTEARIKNCVSLVNQNQGDHGK